MGLIFTVGLGLFVVFDAMSVGLGQEQQFAYAILGLFTLLLALLSRRPAILTKANARILAGFCAVSGLGCAMVFFQAERFPKYILSDFASLAFPVLIFWVGASYPKIFHDRWAISLLGLFLLAASMMAPLVSSHTHRFAEPPILLIVLTWIWVARSRVNTSIWFHGGALLLVLGLTIYSGARAALLLWIVVGAVLLALGFFTRQMRLLIVVGIVFLLICGGIGLLEIDLGKHFSDARVATFVQRLTLLPTEEALLQDASLSNRIVEASDALRSRWDDHGLAQILFGSGHGATYIGTESFYGQRMLDFGEVHHIHFGPVLLYYRYGVPGLVGFFVLLSMCFREVWKLYVQKNRQLVDQHRLLFTLSTIVYLISFCLFNELLNPLFSYCLAGFLATRSTTASAQDTTSQHRLALPLMAPRMRSW